MNVTPPRLSSHGAPRVFSGSSQKPSTIPQCRISVAVICHNYGRFLDECLDSLAAGTMTLHEVFVIDDSSTDNTREVCERRGMRYYHVTNRSIHANRKFAFETATGDVLCFLDADDTVTPDYFTIGVEQFRDPNIGIVYSDCEHFGSATGRTNFPDFDQSALWRDNYIHAGSLVRRDALHTSAAFEQPSATHSHADWTVWKRVVRYGWKAAKQPGIYRYRQHSQSMLKAATHDYFARADLEREPITLFVPLSGRSELWPRFAAQLENLDWPDEQLKLILFDTSQDSTFSEMIDQWIAGHRFTPNNRQFADIRHVRKTVGPPRIADQNRQEVSEIVKSVRTAMARIYNWMRLNVNTQYVFVLEDDVFAPPHVLKQLLRGFDHQTVAVTAPYRSAYGPAFVAWEKRDSECISFFMNRGNGVHEIGGSGFGCLVLRQELLTDNFVDNAHHPSGTLYSDYDVQCFQWNRRTVRKVKIDWSIECDHVPRAH